MTVRTLRTEIQNYKNLINHTKQKRKFYAENIKQTKITYKNIERTPNKDMELSSIAVFLKYLRDTLKDLDQLYQNQRLHYTLLHKQMDELQEKVWI